MDSENPVIRVLSGADAPAYNRFLGRGVHANGDAFRITPADFAHNSFDTSETENAFTLGAFAAEGETWLGIVSVEQETGRTKRGHVAWLVRMYVAASAGGRGIGRRLLRAAVARTRERFPSVLQLNLTVVADNAPARSLYLSEGFTVFAHELDALRDPVSHITHAEEQMRLVIEASPLATGTPGRLLEQVTEQNKHAEVTTGVAVGAEANTYADGESKTE